MISAKRTNRAKRNSFRLWDGEGRDFPDGHRLVLLAFRDELGGSGYIENPNGLSTKECIVFLLEKRKPAYDVWFSFGYDVNQILRDLPLRGRRGSLQHLWNSGRTWWGRMFAKYIPRKFFSLRHERDRFTSADTFSFFQKSFVRACEEWGLDPAPVLAGKAARGTFETWSMDAIRAYNFAELDLGIELLKRLRAAFDGVGLLPQSWHGPGAIAARWLAREGLADHYGSWPEEMQRGVMGAYFGGRIDCSVIGEVYGFRYDIASAYPAGLCDCLSLRGLEWRRLAGTELPRQIPRHALIRVSWRLKTAKWYPFPWRTAHGTVLFPDQGEGWYWGVEVAAAQRLFPEGIRIEEAWVPEGPELYPFRAPIERDFAARLEYKKQKHPFHLSLRLALNSIYGKLAQHLAEGGKVPRWQNYIWAGYTTAFTRAKILDAIATVGDDDMLAVMTDGIITRAPLEEEEYKLGAWENEGASSILIVMPGLYAVFDGDDLKIMRQRGLPASIDYGWLLRSWGCRTKRSVPGAQSNAASHTTFIGMGKALHTDLIHAQFYKEERTIHNVTIGGTTKRIPDPDSFMRTTWREFDLMPRRRPEPVISYPYVYREKFDPKEDKE